MSAIEFPAFLQSILADVSLPAVLFLLVAALVAGLARGFSGFGGALIFVPLASAATEPRLAAALLLIVDGILTLGLLPDAWRRSNRREVATMMTGALIGIPIGTAILALTPPVTLRWIISGIVLGLLVFLASGWRYHGRPKLPLTIATGGVAGVFSGVAQLGGPPVVAYWLGGAIPAATVRANLVLYFVLSSAISAVAYMMGGLLTMEAIVLSSVICPAYGVGLFAGARLFGFANETTFRHICFMLIGLAAVIGMPLFDK